MTEYKWLKFAGLLNECIQQKDHPNCPFLKYRSMDQYQRLEALLQMSDEQAKMMMKTCFSQQHECALVFIPKKETSWEIPVLT